MQKSNQYFSQDTIVDYRLGFGYQFIVGGVFELILIAFIDYDK